MRTLRGVPRGFCSFPLRAGCPGTLPFQNRSINTTATPAAAFDPNSLWVSPKLPCHQSKSHQLVGAEVYEQPNVLDGPSRTPPQRGALVKWFPISRAATTTAQHLASLSSGEHGSDRSRRKSSPRPRSIYLTLLRGFPHHERDGQQLHNLFGSSSKMERSWTRTLCRPRWAGQRSVVRWRC